MNEDVIEVRNGTDRDLPAGTVVVADWRERDEDGVQIVRPAEVLVTGQEMSDMMK